MSTALAQPTSRGNTVSLSYLLAFLIRARIMAPVIYKTTTSLVLAQLASEVYIVKI